MVDKKEETNENIAIAEPVYDDQMQQPMLV